MARELTYCNLSAISFSVTAFSKFISHTVYQGSNLFTEGVAEARGQ